MPCRPPFRRHPRSFAQNAKSRRSGACGGARARGATDQARRFARAARGDFRVDGGLAGIGAAACRSAAGRGLRRQSWRRRAGRLRLSGVGYAGDGREFPGRRRGDQPDLQDVRSLSQSVRTGAGEADRGYDPGAGARRKKLRGDDGLRHGGARLRTRPARAWRDGHRQYDGGRGHLSCALWRAGGGLGRPGDRRRRRRPEAQGRRRARRSRAS